MAIRNRLSKHISRLLVPSCHSPLLHRHFSTSTPRSDIRICFIGDSFTAGAGDDTSLGFPGRLCSDLRTEKGLDITCYNLGIRRDTSTDILNRWEREVNARLKRNEHFNGRLVFSFGTNDNVFENGERRVSTASTLANARSILTRAKGMWPTAMLGPPWTSVEDIDERNAALSQKFETLCEEIDVPFISLYQKLEGNGVWAREAEAGDGIHPNTGGYSLLSQAVAEWDAWESFVRNGK